MISRPSPAILEPGPAWEIARLFPDQGHWSAGDFLALNRLTNNRVELVDGRVEVLGRPTKAHQRMAQYLYKRLDQYAETHGGEAVMAPYPLSVADGRFREPDVLYATEPNKHRLLEDYADACDVAVEVLSEDRARDLVDKRHDYAAAGVPEYWIVDPRERRIIVLKLVGGQYAEHGAFGPGQFATSPLLAGFEVAVDDVLRLTEA